MWEGPATMGGATPGEVALGCIRKVTKPSGQRSPPLPLLHILPPGSFPDPLSDGG